MSPWASDIFNIQNWLWKQYLQPTSGFTCEVWGTSYSSFLHFFTWLKVLPQILHWLCVWTRTFIMSFWSHSSVALAFCFVLLISWKMGLTGCLLLQTAASFPPSGFLPNFLYQSYLYFHVFYGLCFCWCPQIHLYSDSMLQKTNKQTKTLKKLNTY